MPNISTSLSEEEQSEIWNEAKIFIESLSENEVFDSSLSSETLLHRLFHGNNLQISKTKNYTFGCRCSREKLLSTLQTFSQEEINSIIENNQITADCNFCNEHYIFSAGELQKQ